MTTYRAFFNIKETSQVIDQIATAWEAVRAFNKISQRKFGAELQTSKWVEMPDTVKQTAKVVKGYTYFDGQNHPNGLDVAWYFVPCGDTRYKVFFTTHSNDIRHITIDRIIVCDTTLQNIVFDPRR